MIADDAAAVIRRRVAWAYSRLQRVADGVGQSPPPVHRRRGTPARSSLQAGARRQAPSAPAVGARPTAAPTVRRQRVGTPQRSACSTDRQAVVLTDGVSRHRRGARRSLVCDRCFLKLDHAAPEQSGRPPLSRFPLIYDGPVRGADPFRQRSLGQSSFGSEPAGGDDVAMGPDVSLNEFASIRAVQRPRAATQARRERIMKCSARGVAATPYHGPLQLPVRRLRRRPCISFLTRFIEPSSARRLVSPLP
jgi:hypothetical protein